MLFDSFGDSEIRWLPRCLWLSKLRGSLNHWPLELGVDLEESRRERPDEYFNLEVQMGFFDFNLDFLEECVVFLLIIFWCPFLKFFS